VTLLDRYQRMSIAVFSAAMLLCGCHAGSAPVAAPKAVATVQTYPPRPTIAPPPFKVFHQTDNSITLVTDEHASDEQIEAIVWQLHDAAQTHIFDKLHISQSFIDKRDPIVFIHIYRGSKCAPEKYAPGEPPCGGSYHGAGDYTLGSFKNPNRESGVLLHDEDHMVDLWNPDAPNK
jgi:hypothetical protein